MGGKLLRNLKQIGTICFAVFLFIFSVNFAIAEDTKCDVKCDDSNDKKIIKCIDGKLYKCNSGNWENLIFLTEDEHPGSCFSNHLPSKNGKRAFQSLNSGYWDFGYKTQAYFKDNKNYISSSSSQAAYVDDLCWACEVGLVWNDNSQNKCVKASPWQPACYADSSEGDDCIVNKNAKIAKCQSLGSKSNGADVLTCTAWECNTGYLLRLDTAGASLGRCDDEKTVCKDKCGDCGADEECLPELLKTPRTNKENGAYKLNTCQCRKKAGATVVNTSEITDFTTACQNISEIARNTPETLRWKPQDYGGYTMGKYAEDVETSGVSFRENSDGLQNGEWEVTFSYGIVKGQSKCVKLSNEMQPEQGDHFVANFDTNSGGNNCVCKADNGTDWVFAGFDFDGSTCDSKCANKCAFTVGFNELFRKLIYGCEVQQESIESEKPDTKPQEKPVNPQVENAKKVLSNFFASASANRNVWKNEEGKFNTARLASDLGAAVVLGTVGGVVSGTVIKKKQIKKGFESLQCYIGGKPMAGWGDTFNVDLAR